MGIIRKLAPIWILSQFFRYEYISPLLSFQLGTTINPHRMLFLVLLTIFLFSIMRNQVKLSIGSLEVVILLFITLASFSVFASGTISETTPLGKIKYDTPKDLFNLAVYPLIAYLIAKHSHYDQSQIRHLFVLSAPVACYLGLTGIAEHYKLSSVVFPSYIMDFSIGTHPGRARGPFLSAVTMGRMLTITFLCSFFLAGYNKSLKKWLLYSLSIIIMSSIYFTYTRGPWVGFFLALTVLIVLKNKMRGATVFVLLAILAILLSGYGSKFSLWEGTLFSKRQSTVDGRLVNWIIATEMAKTNPVFGVGFGRYNSAWEKYYQPIEGLNLDSFDGNHNTYLGIAAELGFLGLALYLLIVYLSLRTCYRCYKSLQLTDHFKKSFAVTVIAMFTTYWATALFSDLRSVPVENSTVFFFLGLLSSFGCPRDKIQ